MIFGLSILGLAGLFGIGDVAIIGGVRRASPLTSQCAFLSGGGAAVRSYVSLERWYRTSVISASSRW
jgi:hypothetical protein